MKGERDKRLAGWWLQKRVGQGRAQGKENHILAATAPLGQILPWRIFKPLKLLIIKKNNTPSPPSPPRRGAGRARKTFLFWLVGSGRGRDPETVETKRFRKDFSPKLQRQKRPGPQMAERWPPPGAISVF